MFVTIKRRPIGEAPDWVRDAWIGLRLPVLRPKHRNWPTVGVVTGPHGIVKQLWTLASGRTERVRGFVVDANAAVECLEAKNPEAAAWWRENARTLLTRKRKFVFDEEACAVDGD